MAGAEPPSPDWETLGVAGALLTRYRADQTSVVEHKDPSPQLPNTVLAVGLDA